MRHMFVLTLLVAPLAGVPEAGQVPDHTEQDLLAEVLQVAPPHALAMEPSFATALQDSATMRKLLDPEFLGPVPGYWGNVRRAPVIARGRH